ncbi:unnamed protein product [Adineta ricciae]|uniref:Uncharacterized protein n=1 Tax=Adineta ricciae TaxID=249248 RepID=A0A814CPR4_ADIRI|nr:unnamed protein product [Adineta ricciae]
MNDDIGCCSAYFYTRYTDEDTLIDLSMMNYPYLDGKDECILNPDDQPFKTRWFTFTQSNLLWLRIFVFIIIILMLLICVIYLYYYLLTESNFVSLLDEKS